MLSVRKVDLFDDYEEEPMMLDMECEEDELSPEQKAAYKQLDKEHKIVKAELDNIVGMESCKMLFNGLHFKIIQVDGPIRKLHSAPRERPKPPTPPPPMRRDSGRQQRESARKRPIIIDDDDDEEDDIPLAKRIANIKKEVKQKSKFEKEHKSPKAHKSQEREKEKDKEVEEALIRPAESSALGGLTIGNAAKKNILSGPDSKELTFSKIQGKTFPSLVVVARPSLRLNSITTANRPELDSKVKVVLILTPAKFTEWLIQQGLLKSEQRCLKHKKNDLKLGVYSDGSKFPYSGGYVWISDCRPVRFISVFNGSIFEAAPHPPSCILKLIYHWSCQTSIQNVIQWVKVDSFYVKTVYTWLRAICSMGIYHHIRPMGGMGRFIEVGVISLGTTTQDGQQRQVKVEVLGVFDPVMKIIRLRAIEPINEKEVSYKKRFVKILEPLKEWVLKDSILTIDLTIDKGVLVAMGFKNIVQISAADKTAKHTNGHVMDYLRRIVPRMFQNTLSLLSREMIQQFLDELVWREQYGTSPLETFNNITKHLAEQTRVDSSEGLITRLNKIATNPFNCGQLSLELRSSPSTIKVPAMKKSPITLTKKDEAPTPGRRGRKPNVLKAQLNQSKPTTSKRAVIQEPEKKEKKSTGRGHAVQTARRKPTSKMMKEEEKNKDDESVLFEETFYGELEGYDVEDHKFPIIESFSAKCQDCEKTFDDSVTLQMDIFAHLVPEQKNPLQCFCCLERFPDEERLAKHSDFVHPLTTRNLVQTYNCIICETRFNSIPMLCGHTKKNHTILDMPYRCGVCDYRCSSRRKTIEHFRQSHPKVGVLQCNFCLLVFQVHTKTGPIVENINRFVEHVQLHFSKTLSKKCPKCALSFTTRAALKTHLLFDHNSFAGTKDVKILTRNTIYFPMPKLKACIKQTSAFKTEQDFKELVQCLTPGKMCLECDSAFEEEYHLTGFLKCQKCRYQTCCVRAMLDHHSSCQTSFNPESNVHIKLDQEMHCVCGFSSIDGNSLARHLATCDHKSAYPSVESAQENTVKRNMLDMLGLMRRADETDDANITAEGHEEQENLDINAPNEAAPQEADEVAAVETDEVTAAETDEIATAETDEVAAAETDEVATATTAVAAQADEIEEAEVVANESVAVETSSAITEQHDAVTPIYETIAHVEEDIAEKDDEE